ncbi:MAG: RIP metalloprotease RseP [Pseudomonadota bacterium]
MLTSLIASVVLFGILVFVHEFGHFIVAKHFNVLVEKFSLGFGPKLFSKKWGETEYLICLIPLGGYVKMLGEGDEDDEAKKLSKENIDRSFSHKPLYQRTLIVLTGPICNLVLPIIIFFLIFFAGFPTLTSRIGETVSYDPADAIGLKANDQVVAIDGQKIWRWETLTKIIKKSPGKKLDLKVDRSGEFLDLTVTPEPDKGFNEYGEEIIVGKLGILPNPKEASIYVAHESLASKLGLQNNDLINEINGEAVSSFYNLKDIILRPNFEINSITLQRSEIKQTINLDSEQSTSIRNKTLKEIGLYSADLLLKEISENSPASRAGILPGDYILALDGKNNINWLFLEQTIKNSAGRPLQIEILRKGEKLTFTVIPELNMIKDNLFGMKSEYYYIGVMSYQSFGMPEFITDKENQFHPINSLIKSISKTFEVGKVTTVGFVKLFQGKISLKTLGGPIMIFRVAGKAFELGGLLQFIQIIAVFSIILGLINLFPIPVLDGGHLLFYAIEAIKGSPVNKRAMEIAQQVGLSLLLLLMLFTFYNDIMRFF